MNLKTRLEHYFKIRKMRRSKCHIWIVPGGPDDKGVGYIQNYKVGTRSIRKALTFHLKQQDADQKSLTYDDITHEIIEDADEAYSTFCRPDEIRIKWPETHLFSFVRNPLGRLYSSYTNKVVDAVKEGRRLPFAAWGVKADTTFDEFVRIVAETPDDKSERHFRSQSWFLSLNRKLFVDEIGKIENFQEDWESLRQRYGLPSIPHVNRSSSNKVDYRDFYSKESYRLTCERFRDDIELLGYENEV
ncbi:MAG: sulfotransferase family 2 domain-containing protein [Akkermansiaceae bacterium]